MLFAAGLLWAIALASGGWRSLDASAFGLLALTSEAFAFTETDYYVSTMGADLKKQFLLAAPPIDPETLAAVAGRARRGAAPRLRRAGPDEGPQQLR